MTSSKRYVLSLLLILTTIVSLSAQIRGLDLLGKKSYIDIPFELEQGFIIVTARFNNAVNMDFIFDTGAENTIIFDREIPELFGIKYDRRIEVMGSDFNTGLFANISRNVIFKIDQANFVTRDIVVLEENILLLEEKLGINVDGIIGGSFFQNLVVQINYPKRYIRLFHPLKVKKPIYKGYTEFDIQVRNNKPYINGLTTLANGTSLDLTFLMDSGASLPFLIHTNTDTLLTLPDLTMTGNLGYGITGILKGFIGQVNKFEIGPYTFNNLITSFQDIAIFAPDQSELSRNGIIGNHLLRRFYIIIDYFHSKAFFKPIRKRKYAKSFDYDRSGMVIFAVGSNLNEFLVKEIMDNSPAQKSGILPGDIINKIGRRKTKLMSLERINQRLQGKAGKKLKIEIERNGLKMKKEIILQDWFVPTKK